MAELSRGRREGQGQRLRPQTRSSGRREAVLRLGRQERCWLKVAMGAWRTWTRALSLGCELCVQQLCPCEGTAARGLLSGTWGSLEPDEGSDHWAEAARGPALLSGSPANSLRDRSAVRCLPGLYLRGECISKPVCVCVCVCACVCVRVHSQTVAYSR